MNIQGILRRALAAIVLLVACAAPLGATDGQWSINLRDADIRAFIDQVSAMTGKTFVVDQRVKGKITVIAPEPMSSATVYQVFLSVLNVNGFAAVPTGRLVKIVPDGNAKQDSIPLDTSERPAGDAMITRVIAVNNSSATELVPVLRPLVPQSGHLAAVTGANVLVVTDHAENIARLEQVLARIDGADAEELEVVQLQHAWVGDVLDMLGTFITGDAPKAAAGSRQGGSALSAGRVKIVADERTNRLILRGDAQARERIRSLVQTLDVPAETNTGTVQVIRLRHAEAKKTAEILKGMVDGGGSSASSSGSKDGGAAALLNPVGGKIAIQADESLNALVIRADPTVMQQIKAVVSQLDIRRSQILIEAAIVEVGGSTGKDLGVQWASGDPDSGIIGTNFSTAGRSLNEIAAAVANPAASGGLADGVTLAGGKRNADGDIQFGGVLQALASNANVNLLSTPSVLTLDNQEASIVVGENVPFITGSSTTTGSGTSNPFTTIKREDVGIQLKVTPTMIDDENVKLVINQEVSSVKPSEKGVQSSDIITSKRSITTTVLAGNRQTVVLGGLIEDRVTETVKKVPLLGDIPVLGILFRAKSVNRGKQNLMVFLRPSIVRDGKAAGELSAAKYNGVRALAFEIDARGDIARLQEGEALPEEVDGLFAGRGNNGKRAPEGEPSPAADAGAPVAPAESAPAAQPAATAPPAPAPAPVEPASVEPASAPAAVPVETAPTTSTPETTETPSAEAGEGSPAPAQSVQ
ncbi:MAG: type II secretion system secretin GspD [Pseudomonadota bacterium]